MKKVAVFLGGEFLNHASFRSLVKQCDLCVAADRGAEYALACGRQPDHVIGDLDSLSPKVRKKLKKAQFHIHPREKNYSDAELVFQWLAPQHPHRIFIFGALGGRWDHALANLALLAQLPSTIHAEIVEPTFRIYFVRSRLIIRGKKGDRVSMVPFSTSKPLLTTQGLHYKLSRSRLQSVTHGLSNFMIGRKASLRVHAGAVYVFHDFTTLPIK